MASGDEPVYVISVAARLADLPSWMLRVLDQEGLVVPQRTDSNRRLYSDNDIVTLKRVSVLMGEKVNVPGIKIILAMEQKARLQAAPPPPPALSEPEALPLPPPEGHRDAPARNGVRAGSVEELALAIPEVTDLVSLAEE